MQLWRLTDSHLQPGNPWCGFEMMKMATLFPVEAERVGAFVHR
jgi:hypothetical protein